MNASFDARTARTWAEIDLTVIAANARAIARLAGPNGAAMAVVKADAYGHGAVPVAQVCQRDAGIAHFGVAAVSEARELRQSGGIRGDIYVFSPFLPDEAETVVRADLTPLVSSLDQWEALERAARGAPLPARCFLAVDTGMGREGSLPDDARALWERARATASVRITGIATHLSSADECDAEGDAATDAQVAAFYDFVRSLGPEALAQTEDGRGNRGVWLSLANSPGALRIPPPETLAALGARGYLVRGGLLLYGIPPYAGAYAALPELRPALSWRVRVTLVRDLPAGATVGYGRTHTLTRPSRIATLAAGYADGLSRRLSNRTGVILLRGRRCNIVGRISMDQFQVDVTDLGDAVQAGDIATLVGTDGEERQSVLELAELIGTTPHAPTCALTQRVPRLYRK